MHHDGDDHGEDRSFAARPVATAPEGDALAATTGGTVSITLGGRTEEVARSPGETLLGAARRAGLSPPSSCEQGNCATCMARLVEGTVEMRANNILDDDDLADGWILTCQGVPTSDRVAVVYEY